MTDIDPGSPAAEGPPDTTPLAQVQRALGVMGQRHDLVRRLFRLATEWLDEAPLLTEALRLVETACEAEAGSVIMLDRQVGDLYFAAATGPAAEALAACRLERHEGIAGWCMDTGRVIRINGVQDEPRWHREVSEQVGLDVRQIVAAPIRVRHRTIGCLELVNKVSPAESEFTVVDEELLADAAECIGILFALRGEKPER
jgi:signal transduction protein with GAF and PtsI domain